MKISELLAHRSKHAQVDWRGNSRSMTKARTVNRKRNKIARQSRKRNTP